MKKSVCKTLNLEQLDKVDVHDLEALTELSLLQSYFVDDNDTLVPSMIGNNLIDLPEYDGNVVISTPRYMKKVCYINLHSCLLPPPPSLFVKGRTKISMGEIFFWNSSRGTKSGGRGRIQYFVVVQLRELVKVGQFFLNQLQK